MDGLYIRSWYDSTIGYAGAIRGYNGSTLVFTSNFVKTNSWQFVAGSAQQITRFEIDGGNHFLVDDISINNSLDPVPAPPAVVLFGIGMVGLAGFRRLRRRTEVAAV
jgi:hypothetical protein